MKTRRILALTLLASSLVGCKDGISGCGRPNPQPVLSGPSSTISVRHEMTMSPPRPNEESHTVLRNVYYRRGAMRRKDVLEPSGTPSNITIANCDTQRHYMLDLKAHEYREFNVAKSWPEAQIREYLAAHQQDVVQIESKTVDTGERKTFFGMSAKHLVTTIQRPPSKTSGGGTDIIDGWYVDHETNDSNCVPASASSDAFYLLQTPLVTYPEFPQFHHSGPLPIGLAVKLTRTIQFAGKDGTADSMLKSDTTIETLSDSPLEGSRFQLPPGMHENPNLFHQHAAAGH
jgi:hypothetical protein